MDLIPEIPATPPGQEAESDNDSIIIPCGQGTPKRGSPKRLVEDSTYQKVRTHVSALTPLQEKLISLTDELQKLDRQIADGYIANHLRVRKNLPTLPGSLSASEEFGELWGSALQRTGHRLCRVWRGELSKQAKRYKDRFSEKRDRALLELEDLEDGEEAKRLLDSRLQSSKTRIEKSLSRKRGNPRPPSNPRKKSRTGNRA